MKVLVTGAGGFLGGAVTRRLLERGDEVRCIQRGEYPWLSEAGCEVFTGSLTDAELTATAVTGCDAVIHVAAKAGVWGPWQAYFDANVVATRNLLQACRQHGVGRLVYTSTPSVVHSGGDVEGADESVPVSAHFQTAYPATKAIAEKEVLAANRDDFRTVALRPHLIWGPGDPHLVPRVIARAKAGRLRMVGGGSKKVDTVYVDNAAGAHVCALDRLADDRPACAGRAYFITQDEPMPQVEFMNRILKAAGLPEETRSVSPKVAWFAGAVLETAFRMVGAKDEPPMTRFVASQLATAHWYDISGARRDLGYEPRISVDEGMKRLADWLAESAA
jgi:nucleoside-diphosphate-sugar epimerase